MTRVAVAVMGIAILCAQAGAEPVAPAVELVHGLQTGQVWAQFWGGGDMGVNGLIGRGDDGPGEVIIRPGTQFWAQTGGRQGQTSLGRSSVNLSGQNYRQVWIPTACTNINLRAPTQSDVMVASPCPNEDMERLSRSLVFSDAPRPMVQVAVWAVANDPRPTDMRLKRYITQQARRSRGALTPPDIIDGAAALLLDARLSPESYRMFR